MKIRQIIFRTKICLSVHVNGIKLPIYSWSREAVPKLPEITCYSAVMADSSPHPGHDVTLLTIGIWCIGKDNNSVWWAWREKLQNLLKEKR
jgi:hypothetical protein